MKKIFYLASIAALAFSSCAKDETTGVEIQNVGGSKIVAAVEADDTRTELIKGEAGENVFGGGLKDALDALDAKEQAYLELFLGKKVVTTFTHRVAMPMSSSSQSYAVAKISSSKGILAAASQEGEAVTLNVTPSNNGRLSSIAEVDPKDKTAIQVRIADPATCVVMVGGKAVASAVLPIFELGRTAYISGVIKH